jgi:hypothetical protein
MYHAMKGLGTDDRGLVYPFSVLDKSQLAFVAQTYQERHKRSLAHDISGAYLVVSVLGFSELTFIFLFERFEEKFIIHTPHLLF